MPAPLDPASDPALGDKILNVRPDPIDHRDSTYQAALLALPTWHYPGPLEPRRLSVRNQGAEGSCTGQALAAVVDLQNIDRHADGADVPMRVSARMLYEMARDYDEFPDDDVPGSSARGAIKGFFNHGVCSTRHAPYLVGDVNWQLTPKRLKDARRVTLGAYYRLNHVLNDYHVALMEGGAIFCTAMIHSGWEQTEVTAHNGRIILPANMGRDHLRGGHAFAIVGYDPEGFIVLNSWGGQWGGFDARAAAKALARQGRQGPAYDTFATNLPGMAHWAYDDWSRHVMDSWVLRLQAPTNRPSGFAGGWFPGPAGGIPVQPAPPPAAPAVIQDIQGHFIHVLDGQLHRKGKYRNTVKTFENTAKLLRDDETRTDGHRYDHLLFYAHGGLNDLNDAAERAANMKEMFMKERIYPVFFLWRTGLWNAMSDALVSVFDRVLRRSGGVTDLTDNIIEKLARPIVKPIWSAMKDDAKAAFSDPMGGGGWAAADGLNSLNSLEVATKAAEDLKAKRDGITMIYCLTTGLDLCGDDVIAGIESVFGPEVPIIGATSADNGKAKKTFQFYNDQVMDSGIVLVGLADPSLELVMGIHHGSAPLEGMTFEVTKSDGNRIIELDGQPAWPALVGKVGLPPETSPSGAMGITGLGVDLSPEDQETYDNPQILRVPLVVSDDNQSFLWPVRCEEGTKVVLMQRDEQLIFDGVERMTGRLDEALGGRKPVAVFHADCMARGRLMFDRILKDEIIAKLQYPICGDTAVPWLGLYGFSEYAPLGGRNRFHSYTTSLFSLVRKAA